MLCAIGGSLIPRRDRALLGLSALLVLGLIAVLAIWSPRDGDTLTSYGTDTHGAKAAYLFLEQSGYRVERWTRPISQFTADAHTVLILPEALDTQANRRAARAVLAAGGRVLATGEGGAGVLPGGSVAPGGHGPAHRCTATAAVSGPARTVELTTAFAWTGPGAAVTHRCEGLASAVSYTVGRGHAVWWASALPLENATIARADDLELLLASVGPPGGSRVVWDEASPGEDAPSLWQYAQGTPVHLLWLQLAGAAAFALLSFARRSGPLRPDPVPRRAAATEFVSAMGALYAKAHATDAAVTLAYRGFLARVDRLLPVRRAEDAEGVAALLQSRFPAQSGSVGADLRACEAARGAERMPAARALALVRRLHDYERSLTAHPKPESGTHERTGT